MQVSSFCSFCFIVILTRDFTLESKLNISIYSLAIKFITTYVFG